MPRGTGILVDSTGALATRGKTWHQVVLRLIRVQPLGAVSAAILLAAFVIAVAAPFVATDDPDLAHFSAITSAPSGDYWLGTDGLGRDVYSRIVYGTRISLIVGLGVVALALVAGALIGLLSGYYGGWLDTLIQWIMDALQTFPLIVLALAIVAVLSPGLINIIIAVAIVLTPRTERVVRATVLSVREQDYVQAARAIGASNLMIMLRAVLPNSLAPVVVISTAEVASAILSEASLSFLGVGIPPPTATWGGMLAESRDLVVVAPWMVVFPGVAISVVVLAINLFGDSLRDVLDPRLRGT